MMKPLMFIAWLTLGTGWMESRPAATSLPSPSAVPASQNAEPKRPPIEARDVTGDYYFGDGLGVNCTLKLDKQRRFSFAWRGCLGEYDKNEGSWSLQDGMVILKPVAANVREGFHGTAARLYPVRWSDRLYLVSEDEMIDFCRTVNSKWGIDPPHGYNRERSTNFYLRSGDEKKPLKGEPEVPTLYRSYLTARFSATIIRVKDDGTFVIDRGLKQGLVSGTKLKVTEGDFFGYVVKQVMDETADCIARSPNAMRETIRIGMKVSAFRDE